MIEVIKAIYLRGHDGGIEKIKEILAFKRLFFLAMDKSRAKGERFSFINPQKMQPRFFEKALKDGKNVTGIKVCLNESAAHFGTNDDKEFYSAISRKDLLRLCKISELDPDFSIIFVIRNSDEAVDIPVRAAELIPILSRFNPLLALKNFYKTRLGRSYLLMEAIFLIVYGVFYYAAVIEPERKAEKERQNLEEHRLYALEKGVHEVREYDENGHLLSFEVNKERSEEELFFFTSEAVGLSCLNEEAGKDVVCEYEQENPNLYGKLIKRIYPDESFEEFSYSSSDSRLCKYSKKHKKNDRDVEDYLEYYDYDSSGNLTRLVTYDKERRKKVVTYTYDENQRRIYEKRERKDTNYKGEFITTLQYEAWYMYDFYPDGKVKTVTKYY